MGNQYEQSPCLSSGDVPLVATNDYAVCYAIDQQGGKGGANWLNEICPTILSNSHGMPHAVCYATVYDARGNGGGDGVCPTITGDHQDRITDYTAIVLATPHPPTEDMPLELERSEPAEET